MIATQLSPGVFLYETNLARPLVTGQGLALPQIRSEAFGDGSHPTTRLAAGAVDFLCRKRAPHSVLDVGTGTGVLARIARARGAKRVVATDIDLVALASAKANSALDSHPTEIEVSGLAPDSWGPCFDLVIANILEGPLRELAPALSGALALGGALVLSGFTPIQVPALRVTYAGFGLHVRIESGLDGWALLLLER